MSNKYAELDTFIASLGIEYEAVFIPQSLSRNADSDHKSLNWRVSLSKGAYTFRTNYTQGIGHVPGYCHSRSSYEARRLQDAQNAASEKGTYPANASLTKSAKLPAPGIRDVLHSLVIDAEGAFESFEDWCSNRGYDTDSRKAEATYRACQVEAQALARLMSGADLNKLRELLQDY